MGVADHFSHEEIVRSLRLEPADGSHLGVPCEHFYRGSMRSVMRSIFGGDSHDLDMRLPQDFVERYEWADRGYRRVWTSVERRCILGYCEGDLDMTYDPEFERYLERYASAERWYREHR